MGYMPLWRILAWPKAGKTGDGTEIPASSGEVEVDLYSLIRAASFSLPRGLAQSPDDYGASELLQRGTYIEVQLTETGDFTAPARRFTGTIKEVVTDPVVASDDAHLEIRVNCADRLQKARGNGLNMSRQTRMLLLDIEFDSADFDAADPEFLVNIPTDGVTVGYEFVAGMLFGLKCRYTDSGETVTDEYTAGEDYEYGANTKIIYFKKDQATQKVDGVWSCRLYYYDPADLTNTVTEVLAAVATGLPRSAAGGLGIPTGQVDLEEIYGWGANPKVARSVLREKTDGPVIQFLDGLRESALLPYNYRLYIDPETDRLLGRHVYQRTTAIPLPVHGVFDYSHSATVEAVFGRVEMYGKARTPENYSANATVTVNCPADYAVVLAGADGTEVIDGRADTVCNFQRTGKSLGSEYAPQRTAEDAWVLDLGEVKPVRTIMFRGALPVDEGWDPPQPHNLYQLTRNARVTISASRESISSGNPGIPVSEEAINYELDTQDTEEWHTLECTLIHEARYIAIRGDQDAFARISPKKLSDPTRTSWFPLAEVKVLGDGRHRYDKIIIGGAAADHPDRGQVPYCEIKGAGDVATVTGVPVAGTQITLSDTGLAVRLEAAGFMQVKAGAGDPVVVRVTGRTGSTLTIDPAVPGVAVADQVGEYNRWMRDYADTYHDLYFPQLHQKLANTTDWLEIIDDDAVAELADAERSTVERLLAGISVTNDYRMEISLDLTLCAGETTRPYADVDPFLITRCTYQLNQLSDSERRPAVTQVIEGTNYEEGAQ